MNLKQSIIDANDSALTLEHVPEWCCDVYIRQLTVADRLQLMEKVNDDNAGKLSVFILMFTLCDSDGKLLFTNDDYDVLGSKKCKSD